MEITTVSDVVQTVEAYVVELPQELYLILSFIAAILIFILFSLFYNR